MESPGKSFKRTRQERKGAVVRQVVHASDRSIIFASPEAAPILAARGDAVFAGSQQAADDVPIDVPMLPEEDVSVAVE
jgi:hypothetical protein